MLKLIWKTMNENLFGAINYHIFFLPRLSKSISAELTELRSWSLQDGHGVLWRASETLWLTLLPSLTHQPAAQAQVLLQKDFVEEMHFLATLLPLLGGGD